MSGSGFRHQATLGRRDRSVVLPRRIRQYLFLPCRWYHRSIVYMLYHPNATISTGSCRRDWEPQAIVYPRTALCSRHFRAIRRPLLFLPWMPESTWNTPARRITIADAAEDQFRAYLRSAAMMNIGNEFSPLHSPLVFVGRISRPFLPSSSLGTWLYISPPSPLITALLALRVFPLFIKVQWTVYAFLHAHAPTLVSLPSFGVSASSTHAPKTGAFFCHGTPYSSYAFFNLSAICLRFLALIFKLSLYSTSFIVNCSSHAVIILYQ